MMEILNRSQKEDNLPPMPQDELEEMVIHYLKYGDMIFPEFFKDSVKHLEKLQNKQKKKKEKQRRQKLQQQQKQKQ